MSSSNSPRDYPVACPACEEPKGFPFQVRTLADRPGSIEVKLRCRQCHHEWAEIITNNG